MDGVPGVVFPGIAGFEVKYHHFETREEIDAFQENFDVSINYFPLESCS